mmetsp:Transcript_24316/g.36479  ORF Transcript_24316/g.36479 Transcript_24316/m.36479 type:complete len:156 (+) Transcript_24316:143-610(+)
MEGLHAAIIVGMHPKPVGPKICYVSNKSNTRVNRNAELPRELADKGISENEWKEALEEIHELNMAVFGTCCTECWLAAISFTLLVCLPCWCFRYKRQQQEITTGIHAINNKYFVNKGTSVQWINSSKHGPGGLLFYEVSNSEYKTVDPPKTPTLG